MLRQAVSSRDFKTYEVVAKGLILLPVLIEGLEEGDLDTIIL